MKKVINLFIDILVAIMIAFTSIFTISTAKYGYTNFLGYSTVRVLSSSMTTSGINRGDVKLIHSSKEYEVGDIIAFYYDNGNETFILYHQIIEKTEEGRFVTKGSSNRLPEARTISKEDIIGKQVNNGNYKILVSIPFKVSLVLITYMFAMSYITCIVMEVLEDEKKNGGTITKNKKKTKKSILGLFIGLFLFPILIVSNEAFASPQANISLMQQIKFVIRSWNGSEDLNKDAYDSSITLEYALNNPQSESGEALIDAIKARTAEDWVGNMDIISNVSDNLDKVLTVPDGCTYIIKIKSSTRYELYITYENYQRMNLYTRFGPVYKTVYEKIGDGDFEITSSEVGTATVTYYDIKHSQMQLSFNTDEFIKY